MASLIKVFGEYWNPEMVDWDGRGAYAGKLLGNVKVKETTKKTENNETSKSRTVTKSKIDFWDAQGIYILYDNYNPVYVGQTVSLGARIKSHRSNRLADRWDMFSWYSTNKFNSSGKGSLGKPPKVRQTSPKEINDTLEAVAILVANPALNRRHETFTGACEAQQYVIKRVSDRERLEELLVKLERALDEKTQ